ncbi:hypothetical protein J6S37_02470 [Candidatus Saccharibacteria bacterium]|nr:hypothetical protein [Candidatus Saccharibacteria bacterium]
MSRITKSLAKRVEILVATTFMISLFLTSPTFAWGPERTTYTNNSPASYATFNSITDNAAVGDERNFVRVREAGTTVPYEDTIEVEPGKEYEVYIYYHNNAGSNTNSSGYGMATNTRVASAYPTILNTGEKGMISGIITWSYVTPDQPGNAKTGKVWDEAYLTTKSDGVVMRYKTGTAVIHNDGKANGSVLPTTLFTEEGTPIGFNKLTGNLPGCAEYSGYITYTLVAEKVSSSLAKEVSLDGQTWAENVTAKPGQYVTYKITFYNTGNTTLTNIIFKDVHDDGLKLKTGSTKVFDLENTDGKVIDDIIDISGYNVGDAAPGGLRQIIYQAQVSKDESLCGATLNNKILLSYNSADQGEDTASVTVKCDTPTEEDCTTNPNLEGCAPVEETCETNPDLEGCKTCATNPEMEGCEKTCKTNPEMEGCQQLPSTGPLEITMAAIIIAGIGGGGYYLYRTRRNLNKAESMAKGEDTAKPTEKSEKIEEKKANTKGSSQKPDNMVK